VLGVRFYYVSKFTGEDRGDPNGWTGFTYLPAFPARARLAARPHLSVPALIEIDGTRTKTCEHDHDALVAAVPVPRGALAG
jgi:hypothetical protein